ncbi:MAG: DNA polymerase I [Clostridiales bacterium]|nr:DNA polymerase I [Clostridiales bacterium]
MQKLILIDGNSLLNRAFYATPPLTTKEGVPTNAVFAFVNMLLRVIGEKKPTHLLVAFDRKEPTFRHQMYDGYKQGRKPMPDDLVPQVPLMKEVLHAMGICTYEQAGIEADDIIGAAARRFALPTDIYTGDKDSFQLVDQTTTVCFTKRGVHETEDYTAENFTEKTGLTPCQIIDLKSLMGDASDRIPGVPGVGEKTAKDLLITYGSLSGVYENIGAIKGKLKEKLEQNQDLAYLSYRLATIDTGVELPLNLNDLAFRLPLPAAARETFRSLQFFTFLKKENLFTEGEEKPAEKTETAKRGEKQEEPQQPTHTKLEELTLNQTLKFTSASEIATAFASAKKLTFIPTEKQAYFYANGVEGVIPMKETLLDAGAFEGDIYGGMKEFLSNKENELLTYDGKTFLGRAARYGITVNATVRDYSVLKYLVEPSGKAEEASDVMEGYAFPTETVAFAFTRSFYELYQKLYAEGMQDLYEKIELPLMRVLYEMEKSGVTVDTKTLSALTVKFDKETARIQSEIFAYTGEFNLNSPKQLGVVLFEQLQLGKGKKTKTGYATGKEVLDELADKHPVVPLILEYRQKQKLLSTYLSGISPLLDGENKLHSRFLQTITTTGRLSSREPNLQNIPIREDEGKELRKMFVSRFAEGKILSADYSQIELRLLAAFSGCKGLTEAFLRGVDVHSATAANVFGVTDSEVTSAMRRSAKAVNFGVIYGISEYGLAANIKTSVKEAKDYIAAYFATYPEVRAYMDENVEKAREQGYLTTFTGRRRYFPELKSSNGNLRAFGERAAMNMPLQGAAADIIKMAMLAVFKRMQKENLQSKLILQVHDELIVDTAPGEEEAVRRILKEEMEGVVTLAVPLTVEVGEGENWLEAK